MGKISVRDGAGLAAIGKVSVRDGSGLSLVYSSSRYSVSPTFLRGYGASDGTIFVSTDAATIGGDTTGKTILWTVDNPAITIVDDDQPSTIFRASLASGSSENGTATATVNGVITGTVILKLTNGGIS